MTLTTTMFHVRRLLRSSLVLIAILSLCFAGAVFGAEPFEAFLKKHCVRCHGPQKVEGDMRIDREALSTNDSPQIAGSSTPTPSD